MRKKLLTVVLGLTLCAFISEAAGPNQNQPRPAPSRFDPRLGFTAVPAVFIIETLPTLEQAGFSRFDLILSRESPDGDRGVAQASDFKRFMGEVLDEARKSTARLRVLRYEGGTNRPDSADLRLPNLPANEPIGAWILALVITEVNPGGLAETKGVEPGHFVEAVNGHRVGIMSTGKEMFIIAEDAMARGEQLELLLMKWRPLEKQSPGENASMVGKKKTVVFTTEDLKLGH